MRRLLLVLVALCLLTWGTALYLLVMPKAHSTASLPTEMVLPVFVVAVLFFALLLAYPFEVLTVGTVLYLGALPLGWLSWQKHARATAAPQPLSPDHPVTDSPAASPPNAVTPPDTERPTRLN